MKFKIGEMIVRDDTRHPEGTLVVDRHDLEETCGPIRWVEAWS